MLERKHWIFLLIVSALALCILVASFQLGVMIGYRKAMFSYRWGEEYHRNFGGPARGFMPNPRQEPFFGGHGTTGIVLTVDGSEISMRGEDGVERIVVMTDHTKISRARTPAKKEDIKPNERIVVIGRPTDQAKLEALFIRLFDH